jgi:hypothetical protein
VGFVQVQHNTITNISLDDTPKGKDVSDKLLSSLSSVATLIVYSNVVRKTVETSLNVVDDR